MTRIMTLILTLVAAALTLPALAQTDEAYDRVSFSIRVERQVENDKLVSVVYAEFENNDQDEAADSVNRAINWAADQARATPGVEMQTLQYSTRPLYSSRRITGWVARQSLRLETQNSEVLSELLGRLQQRVGIQTLFYELSAETLNETEDSLLAEALARFNHRAELIAAEMGRSGYKLIQVNVNQTGGARSATYGADTMPAPAGMVTIPTIAAGYQTLAVTASGTIELLP